MATYESPHRHQRDSTTIYEKSPSSRHHLLQTPTPHSHSCSSPFTLAGAFTSQIKTRSASRRLTPTQSRTGSPVQGTSPVKFPLSLTTSNDINTSNGSRMTLRSGSSSPRINANLRSPKPTPRNTRSGLLSADSPARRSPLRKHEDSMDHGRISRGSPVAKRRQSNLYTTAFSADSASSGYHDSSDSSDSSSTSTRSSSRSTRPRRDGTTRKSTPHVFDKPHLFRNRPAARQHLDFGVPNTDPSAKSMRRVISVENFGPTARDSPFASRTGPLPSASEHPVHHKAPHPLSHEQSQMSSQGSGIETPQNYKFAKPNPMAFHSTGFVPKRGRLSGGSELGFQPDTPCKKSNLFPGSVFQSKIMDRPPLPKVLMQSPHTPQPNSAGHPGSLLNFSIRTASDLSSDGDIPPTPTKQPFGGHAHSNNLFTANKRPRMDSETTPVAMKKRRLANGSAVPVDRFSTPRNQSTLFPDPSSLSISGKQHAAPPGSFGAFPATPAKDPMPFRNLDTPVFRSAFQRPVGRFASDFHTVKRIGSGEFSDVYQVMEKSKIVPPSFGFQDSPVPVQHAGTQTPGHMFGGFGSSSPASSIHQEEPVYYAIKKSKTAFKGPCNKQRQLEEARILQALKSKSHVVEYIEHWVENDRLFIQTEFCENGSLDKFLTTQGNAGRLDEFRVWKIALELTMGLKSIHESGFMHLDIKPANVLITANGTLKISDFGMAAEYPPSSPAVSDDFSDNDREGDRSYIAPEILHTRSYAPPVDVFALGLSILEIASNQALPENGPDWHSLRTGQIAGAGSLSTIGSGEFVLRDEEGNAIATEILSSETEAFFTEQLEVAPGQVVTRLEILHEPRECDAIYPPEFMRQNGLEELVSSMIRQEPEMRATPEGLLQSEPFRWVMERRREPATVFEGVWGLSDEEVARRPELREIERRGEEGEEEEEEDWDMGL